MSIFIRRALQIVAPTFQGGGLLSHVPDERDFEFGALFGWEYTPKERLVNILTRSIKSQNPTNTCVFQSATLQKEIDEGLPLSVRYLVAQARKNGLIRGNGFASLRAGQEMIRKFGICRDDLVKDDKSSWQTYSSPEVLTYENNLDAERHKSKSYFSVTTKAEWLRALEQKRPIHTGFMWRTAYNRITHPFILSIGAGASVYGHAFTCIGYDLDAYGGVLKFQNSFGEDWGDKGLFYIKMNDWFRGNYPSYVQVDEDSIDFKMMYEGKDIKGTGPMIYRVQNGQKMPYPNSNVFFKYGGRFGENKTWLAVADSVIGSIPTGDIMK